jgi:putative tryptophan/tyrosine transport system substrate-binding protein
MKLKIEVQRAKTDQEMEDAFRAFASRKVDALLIAADPLFNNRRAKVLSLVERHSLPAVYQWREFVSAGGLVSYGPSITEAYYQAGINAGHILKGAKPADIPVVQPTRFYLVVNLTAARKLGISVTESVLATADEVIE